jgi:hypothetical protein
MLKNITFGFFLRFLKCENALHLLRYSVKECQNRINACSSFCGHPRQWAIHFIRYQTANEAKKFGLVDVEVVRLHWGQFISYYRSLTEKQVEVERPKQLLYADIMKIISNSFYGMADAYMYNSYNGTYANQTRYSPWHSDYDALFNTYNL